jgi:ribokinase
MSTEDGSVAPGRVGLDQPVGRGPIVVAGAHIQGLVMRVDQVPLEGESVLGHGFAEPVDGGKATNQAVCAARLGAEVRFITVLGSDERGRRWRAFLEAEGIEMGWSFTSERPTDVGFVIIGPRGIPSIATALDANLELDSQHVEEAAAGFAGTSMVVCQLEASLECAMASFRMARNHHALTVLNPSPAAALPPDLVELTDILVPNEHEAAYLTGEEGAPDLLARRLRQDWPGSCIIVTAGEAGAYVCDRRGREYHSLAPVVPVVDTTGAGDAFLGALAVRLRSGDPLTTAVDAAVLAASRSVTQDGSIPSYGRSDEVAAWAADLAQRAG